ncbi:FHA domain-containing protein [Naumannella halotolerans]|uniref:FHA domain-containing protein n=1 Tax=Naumannella halotolerans TaxID=993414 RepID=A0A4R7JCZ2_9ACTN|nr:FHA domain-containing protein [Naumannella halotolerans]TDT34553.1 FHA domain-containing protein [Naumannella halotolerans]
MTSSANPFVGSWRAGYAPGDWTVLSGPAVLVAVPSTSDPEGLWQKVLAATAIDDLLAELASLGLDETPDLAVFFWADGELRTLIRGRVTVADAAGAPITQGNQVRTWSETGLGDVQSVSVVLGEGEPAGDFLPLVVGAVRAGALTLDASDEALVLSPQLQRGTATGAAVGAAGVAAGLAAGTAGDQPATSEPPSEQVAPAPTTEEQAPSPVANTVDELDEPAGTGAEAVPSRAAEEPTEPESVPAADSQVDPAVADIAAAQEPATDAAAGGGAAGGLAALGLGAGGVAAGAAAGAEAPYGDVRREPTTTPEPERTGAYPQPQAEPNGRTEPEVDAPRVGDSDGHGYPQTMIGESIDAAPGRRAEGPAAGSAGGHLSQAHFGGEVPMWVAPEAPEEGAQRADEGALGETQTLDSVDADPAEESDGDVVLAVFCPQRHPNPPDQSACRWCGQPIERQQPQLIPAPVLATLVPSSGDPIQLTHPVVIGRAPSAAKVADGSAQLLTVPSPSQDISRSHVQVTPEGWDVSVTDLQSTNGTILIAPGNGSDRRRLLPGQPVTVEVGSVLDLGDGVTVEIAAPA